MAKAASTWSYSKGHKACLSIPLPAALLLFPLSSEEFGTLCEHPGAVGAAAGWLEFALSHFGDTQDQKFRIAPGFAGVFTWAGGHAPRWDPRG